MFGLPKKHDRTIRRDLTIFTSYLYFTHGCPYQVRNARSWMRRFLTKYLAQITCDLLSLLRLLGDFSLDRKVNNTFDNKAIRLLLEKSSNGKKTR